MATDLTYTLAETYEFDTAEGVLLPFNEAPNKRILPTDVVKSGSMDTSTFDAYRQGIELTLDKHYQMGLVKIHSGEPERGHRLRQTEFGISVSTPFSKKHYYTEAEPFDPYTYITSQDTAQSLFDYVSKMTFPVVLSDSMESFTDLDGIIEPLPIRSIISFNSIDAPFESKGVKGEVQDGNVDDFLRVDHVDHIREHNTVEHIAPFVDLCAETVGEIQQTGILSTDATSSISFDDTQQGRGLYLDSLESSGFRGFVDAMDPGTDNYVQFKEVSLACGRTFESVSKMGTDSITYGDLYRVPGKGHYTF